MPAQVMGKKPKPAALIVGFDDAMAERIGRLFPARKVIDHLDEVEQKEWDVLITTRSALGADYHLYVIGIGCDAYAPPGRAELPSSFGPYHDDTPKQRTSPPGAVGKRPLGGHPSSSRVQWNGASKASEFHVAENLPASIERLIMTKLGPLAETEETHQWLHPKSVLEPFLTTLLDQYLAGRFPRPGAKSEFWCFPGYAVSIAPEIVEVALYEWQKRDPETFPSADWVNRSRWRTANENRVANELEELQAERTAMLARMQQRERQLESELAEAKREAETGERLLLTAHGDELVRVVDVCLSSLGFQATNMDDLDTGTVRREDLRVTSPDVSDWVALIEIKGYARGGARVNDLLKLGRYRTEYLKETGSEPNAVWYVVNQFEGEDPSIRPPMLSSDESALGTFAEDNGLAIDTADLFRLWMAVKDGRLTAGEARSRLMQARARFGFED
jgi:hypothetical protein